MELKQSLGERVRYLRTLQNMTLEAVAERGELYWTQVQRLEQGSINPTLETLQRVARGLGVPVSSLFLEALDRETTDLTPIYELLQGRTQDEIRAVAEVVKCILLNFPVKNST